jgi:hypothetical protein
VHSATVPPDVLRCNMQRCVPAAQVEKLIEQLDREIYELDSSQ